MNGQWTFFFAMFFSVLLYVVVSLLGPRRIYNMDQILKRGKFAVKDDVVTGDAAESRTYRGLAQVIGITAEFTRPERFLYWATFWWSMGWWFIFVIGTVICLIFDIPDSCWELFWFLRIWLMVIVGIVCTVWIGWGGILNMFDFFKDLKSRKYDENDDGTVREKIDIQKL